MAPMTAPTLFVLGLISLGLCAVAHVAIRVVTARWDRGWLARQRVRHDVQVEQFARSLAATAGRMEAVSLRLSVVPAVCAIPLVSYLGLALVAGPLPGMASQVQLFLAFVWITAAPLLGACLLARSLRLTAARVRRLVERRPATPLTVGRGAVAPLRRVAG
jgi:hypothetical protein